MGRVLAEMEARSFAVFLVVAWCACANSSKDVEELYDDLGPHRVLDAPRSTARGDSVGRLKSRPILGESSQTGSSMEAEKQESWACRESKRCGCAEGVELEMLRRGVELEDLQLLQESFFSQKDELVFLQVGSSSSKWHKEAAAFSGYKSRKPQAAVDSSSEPKKSTGIEKRNNGRSRSGSFVEINCAGSTGSYGK